MRGAQIRSRLLVGPPLTPPLRGHPLRLGIAKRSRGGEGGVCALKSESPCKAQTFDQPPASFWHAFAFVIEQPALQEVSSKRERIGNVASR